MINWKLAGNPLNWVTVLLMAGIGFLGLIIVNDYLATKRNK